MALGGEIINLVGLDLLDDTNDVRGVSEIAVMKDEVAMRDMRILIQVINPIRIEERCAPL